MHRSRCLLVALLILTLTPPVVGWGREGSLDARKSPVLAGAGEGAGNVLERDAEPTAEKEEPKEHECPATFGPLITDTAVPADPGSFIIQPTIGVGVVTNNFTNSWRRVSAGGSFQSFEANVKLTYGLFKNMEVYTVIPYIHNWASGVDEPGPGGERSANFGGLGDINLTFKYLFVEESETLPAISAIFAPTFPSGHYRNLNPRRIGTDVVGGGAYVFTTGFNASKYVKPFILYGNLYYSVQTDFTDDDGSQYPRDFVTANLAVEYPFTSQWVGGLEVTSNWDTGRLFGPSPNSPPAALLSVAPEIEFIATDKLSFALGVNVDVLGRNISAAVTPILSAVYCF